MHRSLAVLVALLLVAGLSSAAAVGGKEAASTAPPIHARTDPAYHPGGSGLRRACEQLRAEGARRIGLEVAVENDRALSLYTSVGFAPVTTEDYFALPVS